MRANVATTALKAQADLANVAVVKYTSERSHTLARSFGPLLTSMGYTWRIESGSSSAEPQRNTVEVWLPSK